MFINSEEIAMRLHKRGLMSAISRDQIIPEVVIEGQEKEFGKLKFVFEKTSISYKVFLFDKNKIESIAKIAINNFSELVNSYYSRL